LFNIASAGDMWRYACLMLQAPENWKLRGGYGGVFLATNIIQKSLNYVS
jgi:hypothetical protein